MNRARFGLCVAPLLAGLLAACASDNQQTVFVTQSASSSANASASASGSASASAAASSSATAASAPTPIPSNGHIVIDSPDASSTIGNPVGVSGTASVLNGTVVGVVQDAGGKELGRATATATAAAPGYGHYDLSITYTGATSGARGQIRVFGVRADGTTPTYYYFITVKFA